MSTQSLHLAPQEQEILRRQRDGLQLLASHRQHRSVFAYAGKKDRLFLGVGCLFAVVGGALNPLLTVIYGQLVASFQDFSQGNQDEAALAQQADRFCLYFVYLAIAMFASINIATTAFFLSSENIMFTLRKAYLTSVLRQNMAFFDNLSPGYVSSCLTSDVDLIHDGISGKLSLSLTAAATFTTSFIITFVESWRLALVLLSTVVAITIANLLGTRTAIRCSHAAHEAYDSAATIAEEALRSAKHILAFGIQDAVAKRYERHLARARGLSFRARAASSIMTGCFMGLMYLSSGLSFWQGSRFLVSGDITTSAIVTCSMAIIIGALAVGKVAPNAQAFVSSITSAKRLLTTIERRSSEDPLERGQSTNQRLSQDQMSGDIRLEDVSLVYPSRDDCLVLDRLSLTLPSQKTTAIIGPSGCGKSSIIGLLERFYQPIGGSVSIAGVNIRDIDLSWWRSQVSLVSQEPVLFHTTIFENIRYGLGDSGRKLSNQAVASLVEQAARDAYAHDFIERLPDGYQTDVGEASARLSGGQRQRIAIARALIKNPSVLLLDEATAALDSKSEALVMKALRQAAKGRTTLLITHRLSTVQDVDSIIVMSKGRMVESGTHQDLMELDGVYAKAVRKQSLIAQKDKASEVVMEDYSSSSEEPVLESPEHVAYPTERSQISEKAPAEVAQATVHQGRYEPEKGSRQSPERKDGKHPYSTWTLVRMACSFNRPEMPLVVVGLAFCLFAGCVNPVQSIFFASSIDSLSLPLSSAAQIRSQIDFWSAMYLMLGLVALLAWGGQGVCLAYCAEAMILRTRVSILRSVLRQDGLFFDSPNYSSGIVSHVLSSSVTRLAHLSGAVLGTILTAFATLAGGIILSLVIGWKLALVCTATIPLVLGCGWARLMVLSAMEAKLRKTHAEAADYASEAIIAIRTVVSLTLEHHVLAKYEQKLLETWARNKRAIFKASALYAASQSVVFLVAALGFWYGSTLIGSHEYSMFQYFICFAALVSGTQSVGAVFSFAPDLTKAKHAGGDVKQLLDKMPHIGADSQSGKRVSTCSGRLDLKGLTFSYPSRPEQVVLEDFSLSVAPGQFVAIVGNSGSGKSTVISLLERFYDPDEGAVLLDGEDVRNLRLRDLRRLFAYVGQEPVMYKGSIRDNLLLCADDVEVSDDQIATACEQAYIKDYIDSLPSGFETEVGSKGVMLSGGQKQRLAIARALLRDAPILILDEATSALDSESEKAVQAALASIRKAGTGRTTIAVAHRLNTIQDADEICVLDQGRVVERGTHADLLRRKGRYAEMYQLQTLERG